MTNADPGYDPDQVDDWDQSGTVDDWADDRDEEDEDDEDDGYAVSDWNPDAPVGYR